MALLFDEAQGAFKDTGSRTSPMKKSTGLMRKQMSKMDEVAPRGHTLAYITPEEAQILNKGGGGIDTQGNQMQGPYGVPMYQGFMDRQRKSREARKKESKSSAITKASSYSSAPPGEKGGGGYMGTSSDGLMSAIFGVGGDMFSNMLMSKFQEGGKASARVSGYLPNIEGLMETHAMKGAGSVDKLYAVNPKDNDRAMEMLLTKMLTSPVYSERMGG